MKYPVDKRMLSRILILCVAVCGLAALSVARTPTRSLADSSVSIVNNSSRDLRNVYISPVGVDDWSGNQLANGATIAAGQSFSLSVTCDQQFKVIAEDQDGCFVSTTVACGSNPTWTITNNTTRDCGSN